MNAREQLDKVIELAYELLMQKLSRGSIENEASFQLEFAYILKTLGQLYEFDKEDRFYLELEHSVSLNENSIKSGANGTRRARMDILIEYKFGSETIKAAIELKFLKKENAAETLSRKGVLADLSILEQYQKEGQTDVGYLVLVTNHRHYVDQKKEYEKVARDFDFRDKKKYYAGTKMVYRTQKEEEDSIQLKNNYDFKWDTVADKRDEAKFFFLKVEVDCSNTNSKQQMEEKAGKKLNREE
jgi:hypothetical protein